MRRIWRCGDSCGVWWRRATVWCRSSIPATLFCSGRSGRWLTDRCPDVEVYAKEVNPHKRCVLIVNKADLIPEHVRLEWGRYFDSVNIGFVFFSAKQASQAIEKEAGEKEKEEEEPVEESLSEKLNKKENASAEEVSSEDFVKLMNLLSAEEKDEQGDE